MYIPLSITPVGGFTRTHLNESENPFDCSFKPTTTTYELPKFLLLFTNTCPLGVKVKSPLTN